MKMTKKELDEIIERHGRWIDGEEDGVWADLSGANLRGVDLSGVNLKWAILKRTNLRGSNIKGANLIGAELSGVSLRDADVRGTDLSKAELKGADLRGTYLSGANLREAELKGADLSGANIKNADLRGADLRGTYLHEYMYQIKGCGSVNTTTTYDLVNSQVIWGSWICKDGNTLENFGKVIKDVYGDDEESPYKKYYQEYIGVINFFKAMEKLED